MKSQTLSTNMAKEPMPLRWESAQQRDEWIIRNADLFTCIDTGNYRAEFKSFDRAKKAAIKAVRADPRKRIMIYAVAGHAYSECYVTTVSVNTLRELDHEKDPAPDNSK